MGVIRVPLGEGLHNYRLGLGSWNSKVQCSIFYGFRIYGKFREN